MVMTIVRGAVYSVQMSFKRFRIGATHLARILSQKAQAARSLKSTTTPTMVGGPKEFGGTKAFKPLVQRDVIVSFGPPEIIVLSLKFHHSRSSAHYHFDIIIIQYFRLLK